MDQVTFEELLLVWSERERRIVGTEDLSHFCPPKLQKPQFGGGAAVIVFEVSKKEREVCHYTLRKVLVSIWLWGTKWWISRRQTKLFIALESPTERKWEMQICNECDIVEGVGEMELIETLMTMIERRRDPWRRRRISDKTTRKKLDQKIPLHSGRSKKRTGLLIGLGYQHLSQK